MNIKYRMDYALQANPTGRVFKKPGDFSQDQSNKTISDLEGLVQKYVKDFGYEIMTQPRRTGRRYKLEIVTGKKIQVEKEVDDSTTAETKYVPGPISGFARYKPPVVKKKDKSDGYVGIHLTIDTMIDGSVQMDQFQALSNSIDTYLQKRAQELNAKVIKPSKEAVELLRAA